MKKLFDCNNCEYCIPKEHEQTQAKEDHMCTLFGKRLFHLAFFSPHDSFIFPCEECNHLYEE